MLFFVNFTFWSFSVFNSSFLDIFPVNPVDLSQPKEEVQHFSKVPLIKEEPTEKMPPKKTWTFFFFPDLISVMFSLFCFESVNRKTRSWNNLPFCKMYSIFWCMRNKFFHVRSWMHWPAWFLFIYSIIIFENLTSSTNITVSNVHLL